MSRAYPTTSRCVRCRMVCEACICAAIVPVDTETRVLLIVHKMEWQKTTNTAALLKLMLENAEVRIRGDLARPMAPFVPDPERRAVLLFPADDAVGIDELPRDRPITLVVPDGNWRQARKVMHREPSLRDLPRVTLPAGAPTRYRVRKNVRGDAALSTAEAVARALAILEGQGVEDALLAPFELMVTRTMAVRGRADAWPTGDASDG